jgi:two-component system, OmpR family, sensor histidine kinase ChvG
MTKKLARRSDAGRGFARFSLGSLKLKLLALIGIFIALPFVIYWQLEEADHKMRDVVTRSIAQQNRLIAQALTPSLAALKAIPDNSLNPLLANFAPEGAVLRLLVRPGLANQFFYVAAVPPQNAAQLAETFDELDRHDISPQLGRVCGVNAENDMRYARGGSKEELLTSVIPIQTALGCWILIASHSADDFLDTSIGRSYAEVPAVHVAAAIYVGLAALSALIALNLWRNIKSFRVAAREVREGRGHDRPFASRSMAPEFAGVAADFDGLVKDLRAAAGDIRQAAEDNAHSFKGPLATIEAAREILNRRLAPTEPRVARTMELMGRSIDRLKALIFAVEKYGQVTADLIETPRISVDLTEVVGGVLLRYQDLIGERELRLKRRLSSKVFVRASKSMLEIVIENIIDNAISFSPPHGTIEVTIAPRDTFVELRVDDEGPGVEPAKLDRVFERYFSFRNHRPNDGDEDDAEPHSGLGLWMVRRNVEAFGGSVYAVNRDSGGLSVRATFPAERGV